jgi:hypothetical protein
MNTYTPYPNAQRTAAPAQRAPSPNQPEKKIRSGAISATIWNNEQDTPNGKVAYKTVSFERTYKDKNGQWQVTNKLRGADIPRAVLVLNKAYEHISLGEDAEAEAY